MSDEGPSLLPSSLRVPLLVDQVQQEIDAQTGQLSVLLVLRLTIFYKCTFFLAVSDTTEMVGRCNVSNMFFNASAGYAKACVAIVGAHCIRVLIILSAHRILAQRIEILETPEPLDSFPSVSEVLECGRRRSNGKRAALAVSHRFSGASRLSQCQPFLLPRSIHHLSSTPWRFFFHHVYRARTEERPHKSTVCQ